MWARVLARRITHTGEKADTVLRKTVYAHKDDDSLRLVQFVKANEGMAKDIADPKCTSLDVDAHIEMMHIKQQEIDGEISLDDVQERVMAISKAYSLRRCPQGASTTFYNKNLDSNKKHFK